jgi:hypothetical protein
VHKGLVFFPPWPELCIAIPSPDNSTYELKTRDVAEHSWDVCAILLKRMRIRLHFTDSGVPTLGSFGMVLLQVVGEPGRTKSEPLKKKVGCGPQGEALS